MRLLNRSVLLKYSPLLVSLFFLLVIIAAKPLYLNQNKEKPVASTKIEQEDNKNTQEITSNEGNVQGANNSVDINLNNQTSGNSSSTENKGTCKVTKNGVTTIVPADQVKINEKSGGDVNIKVECENKVNSSNTSINNNVRVNTSTSN